MKISPKTPLVVLLQTAAAEDSNYAVNVLVQLVNGDLARLGFGQERSKQMVVDYQIQAHASSLRIMRERGLI